MASSSSRKSSSSASKAPKPTYRRASGAKRPSPSGGSAGDAPFRSSAPARTPAASYAAPTKRGAKPVLPKTGSAPRGTRGKRVAPVKAPRATTVQPAAPRQAAPRPAKAGGFAFPFKRSAPRPAAKAPRKLSGASGARPVGFSAGGPAPAPVKQQRAAGPRNPVVRAFAAMGSVLSRLPLPRVGRKLVLGVVAGVAALAIAALVVANSPLFAASEVVLNGSEHVSQQAVRQLVNIPDGTTLFNVDEGKIFDALKANPWVLGVDIKREFPHKLVITPRERTVKAIAYITADEIAWAIGEDGAWIAPLSLSIAVDANGDEVQAAEDGTLPEGAQQLSGLAAALAIAKRDGALLLTDVPSDTEPTAGQPVDSEVVNAGLAYAKGFSADFVAQIKDLSVASVEAISANLTSGVEVSLGAPENIAEKERVVTKLLSQETGVTYINVREPGAYTFRSASA